MKVLQTNIRFNLYDGYTDEEKRNSLVAEKNNTSVMGTDVQQSLPLGIMFLIQMLL